MGNLLSDGKGAFGPVPHYAKKRFRFEHFCTRLE
jgi:hypothetical protein